MFFFRAISPGIPGGIWKLKKFRAVSKIPGVSKKIRADRKKIRADRKYPGSLNILSGLVGSFTLFVILGTEPSIRIIDIFSDHHVRGSSEVFRTSFNSKMDAQRVFIRTLWIKFTSSSRCTSSKESTSAGSAFKCFASTSTARNDGQRTPKICSKAAF